MYCVVQKNYRVESVEPDGVESFHSAHRTREQAESEAARRVASGRTNVRIIRLDPPAPPRRMFRTPNGKVWR